MEFQKIVIVGGGSAGWLTAAILASSFRESVEVVLVESPDVATIGVGEGTWPSMRATLQRIGLSEKEFIMSCDVSLKQGTKFVGWSSGDQETYYHPFSLPQKFGELDLAYYWRQFGAEEEFAHAVSPQAYLCDLNRAAKQAQTPDYAFNVNYGYHLNAGKFAELLRRHCVENLGVKHLSDHVTGVNLDDIGGIRSLGLRTNGELTADFFVDCTGQAALLIGDHLGSRLTDVDSELFNNTALAAQVPYKEADTEISSTTVATAQSSGWIWDIGLSSRRGVGYVYSSDHCSEDEAEGILREYLDNDPRVANPGDIAVRAIKFKPGYRREPWRANCLAIGLSAGFVEPLEASALVLVERSAFWLAENLPPKKAMLKIIQRRFNQRFEVHWRSIVDFLKLHYVISQRQEPYWQDHRAKTSISEELVHSIELWRFRSPDLRDAPRYDELFPAASYLYVLCGMSFPIVYSEAQAKLMSERSEMAEKVFADNRAKSSHMAKMMPTNREFLKHIQKAA